MAKSKELNPHVDYLDECLGLLIEKIGETKRYLADVRWQDLTEIDQREREFKFQATLMDKYVAWINEYARLSGIVEAFQELNGTDEKQVRKGSHRSEYAQMIKNGDFDE